MPGRDGTGPEGRGSLTGRGMGLCETPTESTQTPARQRRRLPAESRPGLGLGLRRGFCGGFGGNSRRFGRGAGRGAGRGLGLGSGRGFGRYPQNEALNDRENND